MNWTGERFSYQFCGDCGCLQIAGIPDDLSRFYGSRYYSFGSGGVWRSDSRLKRIRDNYILGGRSVAGWLINLIKPTRYFDFVRPFRAEMTAEWRIIDVGCGAGHVVRSFRSAGYRNALGVDPFVDSDVYEDGAILVKRGALADISAPVDLLMFHHSLEHIPDQAETLRDVARLLRPGGWCVVRVPLVSSEAWRRYGVHWVQLDAPRHLYLHTERSMRLLGESVGLSCEGVAYDSTAFQFWGSEQYLRGIALDDPRSYSVSPKSSLFSDSDILRFEAEAAKLNFEGKGDSAAFFFRLPSTVGV